MLQAIGETLDERERAILDDKPENTITFPENQTSQFSIRLNTKDKQKTQNPIRLPKRRLVQKRPQLAQRTTEEEYKHQHNQHNEVIEIIEKDTILKD